MRCSQTLCADKGLRITEQRRTIARVLGESEDHPDVETVYRARYRPEGTTLIIAGDVSTEDAVALAERTFGAWQGSAPAAPAVEDRPARLTRATHLVEKAEAA